jgi:hypothetical protein
MAESLAFYQIYYDEAQKPELYDFAMPYFNQGLSVHFENEVIAHLVPKLGADMIGVASWRLRKKRGDSQIGLRNDLSLSADKILSSKADVCILTPRSPIHKPLIAAESWHGKAWVEAFTIFKTFLRSIGITVNGELKHSIYENHFVARGDIYHEYVEKVLKPSMRFMEDYDQEVTLTYDVDGQAVTATEKLFLFPSKYIHLKRRSPEVQIIPQKLGLKDYPIGVFILERLFSIYINDKNLTVKPV